MKNEKNEGKNTSFLKKSRKNKAFFDKNRVESPSLSEDFDQFSDSGDATFCVHLSDYQTIAILVIDGCVVIWSFGHLSKSKTDAVKIVIII